MFPVLHKENGTPTSPGLKVLRMCNLPFRDKGQVSHPQKQSRKEKLTHASQPTPKRMTASYGDTEKWGIEQPTHRPRKGSALPARDCGLALTQPAWRAGGAEGKLDCSGVESLSTEWLAAAYLLAYFLFPAASPPGEAVYRVTASPACGLVIC